MYVLINDSDGSVNFAGDHPINKNLCFLGVKKYEYPDLLLCDVLDPRLDDVMFAKWDFINKKMLVDWEVKQQVDESWANNMTTNYKKQLDLVPSWDQLKQEKYKKNIGLLEQYLQFKDIENRVRPDLIVI